MSLEVIMILIGFVLVGIALSGIINQGKFISTKVGVLLGVLGVILIIFGSYSANIGLSNSQIEQVATGNKLKLEGPVEKVRIISPIDKDSVKCRILTMGVYPQGHTKDVWVVLRPTDDRYYPQSDHTNTSFKRDGEWQVVTRFGGDLGEAYDVIIYETDKEASEFFSTTIENWKSQESYPGLKLEEMPKGAKEVERIVVYLSKNCRGVF